MSTVDPLSPKVSSPAAGSGGPGSPLAAAPLGSPNASVPTTQVQQHGSPSAALPTTLTQIPTVYLPPLHYTYDSATGKLIQITDESKLDPNIASLPFAAKARQTSQPIPATPHGTPITFTHGLDASGTPSPIKLGGSVTYGTLPTKVTPTVTTHLPQGQFSSSLPIAHIQQQLGQYAQQQAQQFSMQHQQPWLQPQPTGTVGYSVSTGSHFVAGNLGGSASTVGGVGASYGSRLGTAVPGNTSPVVGVGGGVPGGVGGVGGMGVGNLGGVGGGDVPLSEWYQDPYEEALKRYNNQQRQETGGVKCGSGGLHPQPATQDCQRVAAGYGQHQQFGQTPLDWKQQQQQYQQYLQQQNQHQGARPQGPVARAFAQTFRTAVDTAQDISRAFDRIDASTAKRALFSALHPASGKYQQAAMFKFDRLENVPVNPNTGLNVSFSLSVYFDPNGEALNQYKTKPQPAIPCKEAYLANCDLHAQVVKVPWYKQEFVYIKVVEVYGQLETIVGRLKLQIASLYPGHPLRVAIIGDDGLNKGHALFEFGLGYMSSSSFDEATRPNPNDFRAAENANLERRAKTNRMPEYEEAVRRNYYYRKNLPYPRSVSPVHAHGPGAKSQGLEVQMPAALNHLVRWCCDITDQDLY